MHQVLIRTPWLDIHTYGVLVALGFVAGLWLAAWRGQQQGLAREKITDLGVWLIIAGMAGGKLFHIIFFWNEFIAGWRADGLRSLREGFVFYGGFIVAALAAVVYARVKRLPLAKLADVFAPSIALGHAFGRLGCFFNGCCYGKATSVACAVTFPPPHVMAGIAVHPTQLYEVIGNFGIFFGLSAFYRHKRFDGQVWWLYVLGYGLLRFVVELFRGDYPVYYFGGFTIAQFIAAAMIAAALVGLKRCRRSA